MGRKDAIHHFINALVAPLFIVCVCVSSSHLLHFQVPLHNLSAPLEREHGRKGCDSYWCFIRNLRDHDFGATSYEYARKGARLVIVARREECLQQVAKTARRLGSPDVVPICADVSNVNDCKRFVDETINHFGRLLLAGLGSMGLWDLVENGYTEPESVESLSAAQKKQLEEVRQRDANALSTIQRGLAKSIFPRIIRATKAKEAWDILEDEYHGDAKVRSINLLTLRRDLENMKMKESETLTEFFTRFVDLVNQMKTHGEEISDRRMVKKILICLLERFDPKVAVIEETRDIEKLSVQDLIASLKSYEQRTRKKQSNPQEVPFEEDLQGEEEEMEMKEEDLEKEGEEAKIILIEMLMVKDCRSTNNQQAKCAEERGDEENLFYACQSIMEHKNDVWFLDSGCSNHMAANKNVFLDMDSTFKSHVKLGNGALVEAKGKGTIGVQTNDGSRFIRDVLLVSELDQNLLSVGQLLEHGYKLDFLGDGCIIYDNGKPRKVVKKIKMQMDHLVNNAGIRSVCHVEDADDIKIFAPVMASKAALLSFYEALRVELAPAITITIATPGFIETEMTQGKHLSKEGAVQVDQQLADEIVKLPVMSSQACAKAVLDAVGITNAAIMHVMFIVAVCLTLPPFFIIKLIYTVVRRYRYSMETIDMTGKVVLITGASSGIGEHLAYEYAKKGACLVLVARRESRLREVAERARKLGSSDVLLVCADVSDINECKRFVDETINHFGRLDHLVNNAGIGSTYSYSTDVTKYAPVMDINFWGSVYPTYFAIPHLKKGKGKIVVNSSAAAMLQPPKSGFYGLRLLREALSSSPIIRVTHQLRHFVHPSRLPLQARFSTVHPLPNATHFQVRSSRHPVRVGSHLELSGHHAPLRGDRVPRPTANEYLGDETPTLVVRVTVLQHKAPIIQYRSDLILSYRATMLRYVETEFPDLPLMSSWGDETPPLVVRVTVLQHKSVTWHIERLVRWAEDMWRRGRKSRGIQ
ncbi:hypothetical protein RJ639_034418 [Escallonia herrerae]|uniref:Retrovirus-related Pol polyprotein from transposon TNT 1-94-like beta-barrel domain-containing protein n=1 Tax=Escallonia herrerae TaxID=1293975 RepID=A0AA88WY70_9ASTE|nr:hypothetical protein RJ639_034418 [Escallonia herrerae]